MTNEEREALIAQGWTPPKVVDPDPDIDMAIAYTKQLFDFRHPLNIDRAYDYFLNAIKQARGLERAEAKTRLVWLKHDGSEECPVSVDQYVWVRSFGYPPHAAKARNIDWRFITHYAILTPPTEDGA